MVERIILLYGHERAYADKSAGTEKTKMVKKNEINRRRLANSSRRYLYTHHRRLYAFYRWRDAADRVYKTHNIIQLIILFTEYMYKYNT